ncbi:MAG: 3-phosphoshikimate 1-carboxyvinyltransferase [Acidobacteriota bacterium]|jgi:3-phosphoshikimate 1-carboxyvinyltransferase|nr:3-phosphoshikimate 1-carboxyvinyltransferase [Acidobacteriota bacterium]
MIWKLNAVKTLSGTVHLPGDKSISHRYAMLAAIAEGESVIRHFAASQDCHSTLRCLSALGATIVEAGDDVAIQGRGLRGLRAPEKPLDAENSGTTIRLLSGILAGHDFTCSITGDASLLSRPMGRIIQPLRLMGANIEPRERDLPPLVIRGGSLKGIRYSLPVASAQVKSCVLLAGLYAGETTAVEETVPTRDHTEIALREFGAAARVSGGWIEVDPAPRLRARRLTVPGDLSGAAFFLAAAAMVPDSDLTIPGVSLNGRRRELLNYLERAGMDLCVENETTEAGEARGDLRARYSAAFLKRRMPDIKGPEAAALIDEIPILAVLGSQTAGGLEISGAEELRVKESDRISALAVNLRAMGAEVMEKSDGLIVSGGRKLRGADIETRKDHRIAMAFAIAGLAAEDETRIHDAECVNISFPGFLDTLKNIAK